VSDDGYVSDVLHIVAFEIKKFAKIAKTAWITKQSA
jgi:hypothetical protein